MKILVLSNTPWSNDNSFGNSFSNIFSGIEGIEIANIYCRYGDPNNEIVVKHFQITEKSLLKNLKNRKYPSGREVTQSDRSDILESSEKKLYDHARKKRLQIFFWARNIIWKIGRWKSEELINFISEFNPDIIFQPVYYSTYLNDIALFIKKFTKVPMVCYVSDDVYTLRQISLSPLFWIDRFIIRTKIRKLIDNSEYLYVISDTQKREYEKCFNKECKVLTKGADFNKDLTLKTKRNNPLKLVYTGNIGDGRWKTLSLIGNSIKKINADECKVQLFIYTMTPITNKMKESLDLKECVFLMGGVSAIEVERIQKDADVLIHVESFGLKERYRVHQSFSTKLVDYFYRARCIFAVGAMDVASIDYLIEKDAAIVATSEKEVFFKLNNLVNNPDLIDTYGKKAWDCGKINHRIDDIQAQLYQELNRVVNNFH